MLPFGMQVFPSQCHPVHSAGAHYLKPGPRRGLAWQSPEHQRSGQLCSGGSRSFQFSVVEVAGQPMEGSQNEGGSGGPSCGPVTYAKLNCCHLMNWAGLLLSCSNTANAVDQATAGVSFCATLSRNRCCVLLVPSALVRLHR